MNKKNKVKKEIEYDRLIIKLYDLNIDDIENDLSIGNIEAFDLKGSLVWTVQAPTHNVQYYDMQIDEENKELEADSGAGRLYKIDLSNGQILNSFLIK